VDADEITTLLRLRRRELKLSQQAVADLIGTAQSAISELEVGARPRLGTLIRWAHALGYDVVLVPREVPDGR
jgi:transcriptional regulator with XRE-family HTH domain